MSSHLLTIKILVVRYTTNPASPDWALDRQATVTPYYIESGFGGFRNSRRVLMFDDVARSPQALARGAFSYIRIHQPGGTTLANVGAIRAVMHFETYLVWRPTGEPLFHVNWRSESHWIR